MMLMKSSLNYHLANFTAATHNEEKKSRRNHDFFKKIGRGDGAVSGIHGLATVYHHTASLTGYHQRSTSYRIEI